MALTAGPLEITIGTGVGAIVLTRAQQLADATLTINRPLLNLVNQSSTEPSEFIRTGLSGALAISVADWKLENIALAFGTTIVVDATVTTKRKVLLSDRGGCKAPRLKVVLKPYDCDAATTNKEEWITFPSAELITPDAFTVSFGLQTQRSFSIGIMALPDPVTGVRVIIGDETATPA